MQNKSQEVISFLQFEIMDGRVICLYRCSTGPTQALGCDRPLQAESGRGAFWQED